MWIVLRNILRVTVTRRARRSTEKLKLGPRAAFVTFESAAAADAVVGYFNSRAARLMRLAEVGLAR